MEFIRKVGKEIESAFVDLAKLRIEVFHDYPYLYEGTLDYELEYLKTYANSEKGFLFAVYDQGKMVGATTAIPLVDETEEVQIPFIEQGFSLDNIFYFGESILLKSHRGIGLGHRFFDERETFAQGNGFQIATFCSVDRGENHPLKPSEYRPNDVFWTKRGYTPQPHLVCEMSWLDIGETQSTRKPLRFWLKNL
ncbi:GNAT family N-acetyltransferase [Cellulophaga sp. BC115SP]|uniref:GNAT family N-acetyltransferase n=1 Tax=Cellulophaga sp. BC115SP TaxID=2683263 RepID=UPI001412438C|nr:GNAT family N-acetyltransferase [Cellulophaga sp. BC115SP]NBB29848.1 GNAT family N-acetyltransferase [Cellulophaga sp. BC115SP]